ncbi:MAG: branched-chain amino acid ABC transporter substrate-binding protein, partial [Chloroflexota bacterium]
MLAACGGSARQPSASPAPASIRAISAPAPTATPSTSPTSAPTASTAGTATPQPARSITIGLAAPFSGLAADFGAEMLKGARIAVDEVNRSGGINGRPLALDQADDKGDPAWARAAAKKLVADHVLAVIGPATSAAALAEAPVYERARVPMITPSANDPALTDAGLRFIFRAAGRWDQEPPLLEHYLVHTLGKQHIALVADSSGYGQLMAAAMRQALSADDLTPVVDQTVPVAARDDSAIVASIKAKQAGAVFFGGYYPQVGLLARQLRSAGVEVPLALTDAAQDQALVAEAGPAANGAVLAFPPDASRLRSAE